MTLVGLEQANILVLLTDALRQNHLIAVQSAHLGRVLGDCLYVGFCHLDQQRNAADQISGFDGVFGVLQVSMPDQIQRTPRTLR